MAVPHLLWCMALCHEVQTTFAVPSLSAGLGVEGVLSVFADISEDSGLPAFTEEKTETQRGDVRREPRSWQG